MRVIYCQDQCEFQNRYIAYSKKELKQKYGLPNKEYGLQTKYTVYQQVI